MKAAESRELLEVLKDLSDTLEHVPQFDPKLADYVFFPLSHLFSKGTTISPKIIAVAIKCLQSLIKKGWGDCLESDLFKQLFILLTAIPARSTEDDPDQDLLQSVIDCYVALLHSMPGMFGQFQKSDKDKVTPMVGQMLVTMLIISNENKMPVVQLKALTGLESLISAIEDVEILQSFFPGIVSKLTKILQPSTQHRRTSRVLVLALNALSVLFRGALPKQDNRAALKDEGKEEASQADSWIQASSSQIVLALSKISKLQRHEKIEVRHALSNLWFVVVNGYQYSLANCQTLAFETIITICAQESDYNSATYTNLKELMRQNQQVQTLCKDLCHKWLSSLPRALQSTDTSKREHQISRIKVIYQFLLEIGIDLTSVENALAGSLRDCVSLVLESQARKPIDSVNEAYIHNRLSLIKARDPISSKVLSPRPTVPFHSPAQQSLEDLFLMVNSLYADLSSGARLVDSVLSLSQGSRPVSLWMLARVLDANNHGRGESKLSLHLPEKVLMREHYQEIALSQATAVLSSSALKYSDERVAQIGSLEILVILAQRQREAFRFSLVDTLYPIVEILGSRDTVLKDYAIQCLDYISLACGYIDTGDMIIQNVDYLVNAVALKLNTFDIGPQAPQTLVMMLELSGSRVIPYLDDILESVFAILASYHGYSRLVESLFFFLSAIVEQASTRFTAPEQDNMKHRKMSAQKSTIHKVPELLDQIGQPSESELLPSVEPDGDVEQSREQIEGTRATSNDQNDAIAPLLDISHIRPKIYTTVQSILRLSQFHLTREESHLRCRLLELITSGCQILSADEDEFLPLVNDLWPVMVRRLYDEETVVSLAAMKALSKFAQGAGDFLSTRIEDEWPSIKRLYSQLEKQASALGRGKANRAPFALATRAFEAIVDMIVELTYYVHLTQEIEDDIFDMLATPARSQMHVKRALERLNNDALWLALDLSSFREKPPVLEGFDFQDVEIAQQSSASTLS